MYVCMYVCMYVGMYVCMHEHTSICPGPSLYTPQRAMTYARTMVLKSIAAWVVLEIRRPFKVLFYKVAVLFLGPRKGH